MSIESLQVRSLATPFDDEKDGAPDGHSESSQNSPADDLETFQFQEDAATSSEAKQNPIDTTIDDTPSPLAQTVDQIDNTDDQATFFAAAVAVEGETDADGTILRAEEENRDSTHQFDNSDNVAFKEAGDTHLKETLAPEDSKKAADSKTPFAVSAKNTDSAKSNPKTEEIPGFKILDELGRGAFGVVYRARDINLDRQVAIKIPLLRDKGLADKYLIEARNAAKIDSVGIVPVFQVGSTESGQPFVVQKLIDGSTLSSILRKSATLPASWAIGMVQKIATAIGEAHKAGLVHRDLKPANILIDQSGDPWVADFGLSVFEEDQKALRGEVAGTPLYMAPEQLSGRADWLDGRADIWALGVILYESLAGKPPFDAEEFRELKEQIKNRHPKPLTQRNTDLPSELDEVFNRCCSKDVSSRYASANELASQLESILADSDLPLESIAISAAPDGRTTIRSRAVANTQARKSTFGQSTLIQPQPNVDTSTVKWLGAALAVVAIICIVGFFLVWQRLGENSGGTASSEIEIPAEPAPADSSAEDIVDSESADTGVPDTETPIVAPEPAKRPELIVSEAGDTAYLSLADAVRDALPNETIVIRAGTYTESIVIDKSLEIRGEGSRDEIVFVASESAAFEIKNDSALTLTNVSISAEGDELNAIELISGQLELKSCKLSSNSYDCLKAHDGSTFLANGCRFESHKHPAIVASGCKDFEVSNCDFRFDVLNLGIKREDPVVGIQLTDSTGKIRECTFTGTGELGKGISAAGSSTNLMIANCNFTSLQHGVELFECSSSKLISRNRFSECEIGIYAESGDGELRDLEISGCDYSVILLRNAKFSLRNAKLLQAAKVGLWLDESQAQITQSEITGSRSNSVAVGVMVDRVDSDDITLLARELEITANRIGLLFVSGRVRLEGGLISANGAAGIAVIDSKSLKPPLNKREGEARGDRVLEAENLTINASKAGQAVLFNTSGSYKFESSFVNDLANQNRPWLPSTLTTKQRGDVVEVVER